MRWWSSKSVIEIILSASRRVRQLVVVVLALSSALKKNNYKVILPQVAACKHLPADNIRNLRNPQVCNCLVDMISVFYEVVSRVRGIWLQCSRRLADKKSVSKL